MGLIERGLTEYAGWLWINPIDAQPPDLNIALHGLADELATLGADEHVVFATDTQMRTANWKLLVEGGLEAYHFKVAHRDTIGPYFADNLSTYAAFGPHFRSILARSSVKSLSEEDLKTARLRDHAQVLYTLFPNSSFLVQPDHIAWIRFDALAPDQTQINISTVVPQGQNDDAHWQKNHAITLETLNEDFAIAESIQAGLASGANSHLTFGQFEGALTRFNEFVETELK